MSISEYFTNMCETAKETGKPVSNGEWYAYRAWSNTEDYKAEMFEAVEIPWGSDLKNGTMVDFVNALKNAGVTEFAVTDHSTALMEGIYALVTAGCSIKGPAVVKRHPAYWGDEEHIGLIFTIN